MYLYQRGDGSNKCICELNKMGYPERSVNLKVFSLNQGENAFFINVILVLVFTTQLSNNIQNDKII